MSWKFVQAALSPKPMLIVNVVDEVIRSTSLSNTEVLQHPSSYYVKFKVVFSLGEALESFMEELSSLLHSPIGGFAGGGASNEYRVQSTPEWLARIGA
jgi:hypothetical protein